MKSSLSAESPVSMARGDPDPVPLGPGTALAAPNLGSAVLLLPWGADSQLPTVCDVVQCSVRPRVDCQAGCVTTFGAWLLRLFSFSHFSLGIVSKQSAMARTAWQPTTFFGSRVGYTSNIDSANEVLQQPRPSLWFAPALN